jgi:GntR family transcriptional regulator
MERRPADLPQLRDLVIERVMDGSFPEGEAIPSVRQVATDYRINHLTVGRAYQELVDMGLLEKRPGPGHLCRARRAPALTNEKQRFLDEELPAFAERIRLLGLSMSEVAQRLSEGFRGTSMQTIIEARDLRRSFGDIHAVDGINLTVNTGSVVGLIGPNGAGKTTLLRALLGLTRCEGELSVLG